MSRRVEAPAQRLWSVISTPRYLERWHPFCEANPVERWPGVGAADTIHYYGGRVVRRHFTAWHEGAGFDLVVTTLSGDEQASVRWRIEPQDESTCRLTVILQPLYLSHLPGPIRWAPYLLTRFPMTRYLESAVAGVVHHTETGESVSRNQFGAHRWFSPAHQASHQ